MREKRIAINDFNPSRNHHYLGFSAHNFTWIKGAILEVVDDAGDMIEIMSLPNGRRLHVERDTFMKNTKEITHEKK